MIKAIFNAQTVVNSILHGENHRKGSATISARIAERGRQMFNVKCPECGGKLVCHCVYGSDETSSGLTERMYCCVECLSTWITHGDGEDETELQRYFFG